MPTETLRPDGAGDVTNWDTKYPNTGQHYQKVNEEIADEDNTYIATKTTGSSTEDDLFEIDDTAISEGATIENVRVYVRARNTDAYMALQDGRICTLMKTNGTTYVGDSNYPPDNYTDYYTDYTINPSTSLAWTLTDLDNLQIGARGNSGIDDPEFPTTYYPVRCTQVWAVITYSLGAEERTSEYSIDVLFEELNVEKEYDLDVLFSVPDIPETYNLDVVLQDIDVTTTYYLNVLFCKIDTPSSYNLDSMFVTNMSTVYSIDTAIESLNLSTTYVIDTIITNQLTLDWIIERTYKDTQSSPKADFVNSSTVDIQHSIWLKNKRNMIGLTARVDDIYLYKIFQAKIGIVQLNDGVNNLTVIFEDIEAEYDPIEEDNRCWIVRLKFIILSTDETDG